MWRVPSDIFIGVPVPGQAQVTRIRQSAITVGPGTTPIVAVDASRRGVVIKNTTAATGAVIGDATVTWAGGAFLLGGGESITLIGVEAIFGDSAAGVLLSVLEELL
jgi:hypothetical protein